MSTQARRNQEGRFWQKKKQNLFHQMSLQKRQAEFGGKYFIIPRSFLTQQFQKFHQSTGWSTSHAWGQIFYISRIMHNSSYVQVHPIFASHKFLKRDFKKLVFILLTRSHNQYRNYEFFYSIRLFILTKKQ